MNLLKVSYENETGGEKNQPGLRVVGSAKQLQDDAIREALDNEVYSDEEEFAQGLTFMPKRESRQEGKRFKENQYSKEIAAESPSFQEV